MEDEFCQIGNDQQLFDGVDQQIIDEEPYEQLDEDPNQDILDEELHQPATVDDEPNQQLVDNLPLEATTTLTLSAHAH